MKKIYLVIEEGAGTVRMAYELLNDAKEHIEELKSITDIGCFYLIKINYQEANSN